MRFANVCLGGNMKIFLCWIVILNLSYGIEKDDQIKQNSLMSLSSLDSIYKQILPHNNYLHYAEFEFRCANLNRVDFRNLNLKVVDFRRLNLSNIDFSGSLINQANFSGSVLYNINFSDTNLSKTDFRNARLEKINFEGAILNGARFKGCKLLDIQHSQIRSAKGCLFEDKKNLCSQISHEQESKDLIKKLFKSPQSIILCGPHTYRSVYNYVLSGISELQEQNQRYALIDFRNLESVDYNSEISKQQLTSIELRNLTKEFSNIIRRNYFSCFVDSIYSKPDKFLILVKLKNKELNSFEDMARLDVQYKRQNGSILPKLDLYGKIPLDIKHKRVFSFIKDSYIHGYSQIEIITGRGLNNPSGVMRTQWSMLKTILKSKACKPYVESMHSISKDGGWKVLLKNYHPHGTKRKNVNRVGLRLKNHKKIEFLKIQKLRDLKENKKIIIGNIDRNIIKFNKKHKAPTIKVTAMPSKSIVTPSKDREKSESLKKKKLKLKSVKVKKNSSPNLHQPSVANEKNLMPKKLDISPSKSTIYEGKKTRINKRIPTKKGGY